MDFTELKQMLKDMMRQMMESFGSEDSLSADKLKELDDFDIDMTNLANVRYDQNTSWVTGVDIISDMVGTDPGVGKRKTTFSSKYVIK